MRTILVILTALSFASGFLTMVSAKSAIHEIGASVLFLIAAVFLSSSFIVGAITQLQNKLVSMAKKEEETQAINDIT